MSKRGRPPLPPERRRHVRVIVRTEGTLEIAIRSVAEYHGKTVQDMTREWWERLIDKESRELNFDFRGASKNI